jgi:hypothetical protein
MPNVDCRVKGRAPRDFEKRLKREGAKVAKGRGGEVIDDF